MKAISLRAPEDVMKRVERLAKLEKVEKSLILREALEKGIAQLRLEMATKLFNQKKISIGEAAQIAGMSVGEMMQELMEKGVSSGIEEKDLRESLQVALRSIK